MLISWRLSAIRYSLKFLLLFCVYMDGYEYVQATVHVWEVKG